MGLAVIDQAGVVSIITATKKSLPSSLEPWGGAGPSTALPT